MPGPNRSMIAVVATSALAAAGLAWFLGGRGGEVEEVPDATSIGAADSGGQAGFPDEAARRKRLAEIRRLIEKARGGRDGKKLEAAFLLLLDRLVEIDRLGLRDLDPLRVELGRWAVDKVRERMRAHDLAGAKTWLARASLVLAGTDREWEIENARSDLAHATMVEAARHDVQKQIDEAKALAAAKDFDGARGEILASVAPRKDMPDLAAQATALAESWSGDRERLWKEAKDFVGKRDFASAKGKLEAARKAAGAGRVSDADVDRLKKAVDLVPGAVLSGLRYLVRSQQADGHFEPRGQAVAATALAALALVGWRRFDAAHEFEGATAKASAWLLSVERGDGSFQTSMYGQAMGTLALLALARERGDAAAKAGAERALRWNSFAQGVDGGWRYQSRAPHADTSVTGWFLQGFLDVGPLGIEPDADVLRGAWAYLDSVRSPEGFASYQPGGGGSPNMTAVALYCRLRGGTPIDDPWIQKAAIYLQRTVPVGSTVDSYLLFYGTEAMLKAGGGPWDAWWKALIDVVLPLQVQQDPAKPANPDVGSFPVDKAGGRAAQGGPVVVTALVVMSLENWFP